MSTFPSLFHAAIATVVALAANLANAATPSKMLAGYVAQAGKPADPTRGKQWFVNRHGQQWACASGHGASPTQQGEHAATGKPIAPLAPHFISQRFTDPAKTEKWFRRESWQRLMRSLPHHFGTDASLDPATIQQLSTLLERHAGTDRTGRPAPAEDRVTRWAWFQIEHHQLPPRTWQLPRVRSASNCAACHVHANQGVFDEHDVRIPR